jgi:hypothetical protein
MCKRLRAGFQPHNALVKHTQVAFQQHVSWLVWVCLLVCWCFGFSRVHCSPAKLGSFKLEWVPPPSSICLPPSGHRERWATCEPTKERRPHLNVVPNRHMLAIMSLGRSKNNPKGPSPRIIVGVAQGSVYIRY